MSSLRLMFGYNFTATLVHFVFDWGGGILTCGDKHVIGEI